MDVTYCALHLLIVTVKGGTDHLRWVEAVTAVRGTALCEAHALEVLRDGTSI